MERLNDIMGRATRRQQPGSSEGQSTSPQGQRQPSLPVRRPLPEQTARLGQNPYASQVHNQHNLPARTRDEQGHPLPAAPRPGYPRQRPPTHDLERSAGNLPLRIRSSREMPVRSGSFAGDSQHFQHLQHSTEEPQPFQHHTTGDYLHPSAVQADVQDEWEDDTAGMRYGDWENDEDEGQIGQSYLRPKASPLPRTSHQLVTRNLRDAQALPPHLPSPQAPPQEVRRSSHRLTQPLTPQAIARMNQELPQDNSLTLPMPSRQIVVSASVAVQGPTNIPPLSPANCPICKGAGYLRVDVPYGHPNFGKPIPCECKEAERKEKRRRQLREMSNLDAFRDKSFKNFNPRVPGVQEAYQVALEYAQNPQGWLVFIGKNGCGKTHLAAAIANQHLARGSLVLFAVVPELLDHLRATFAPNSPVVYDQLFSTMREAELLILDDLGSEQNSPWACEKLFQLLNYRYNSHFPTVITTNNIRLQAVDERIRSRLMDKNLVTEITFDRAQDYRPHNPRRD